MICADCGRFPDPSTGGFGWWASTEEIDYCPSCKVVRRLGQKQQDSTLKDAPSSSSPGHLRGGG